MDLIDRQAAIDKFKPWLKVEGYSEGERNMLKGVLYELTVMPPAQPELIAQDAYVRGFEQGRTQGKIDADLQQKRKTGYWTLYDKRFPWLHDYKCSQCDKRISFSDLSGEAKFCPYCGAKMEGILNG